MRRTDVTAVLPPLSVLSFSFPMLHTLYLVSMGPQRPEEASDSLALKVQVVRSLLMCVLGTEPGPLQGQYALLTPDHLSSA